MKLQKWMMIAVMSLGFGLSLYGQQPTPAPRGRQFDCLQQPASPLPWRGLSPLGRTRPCKPVLAGAETQQPSNDVPHHDDGGTWITVDIPGASSTVVVGINLAGTVTGYSYDANFVAHGFLRLLNGAITTFDVPGSVGGTYPGPINDAGEITGSYLDADFVGHGFLRRANGAITTFDASGSVYTAGAAINAGGEIAGDYFDENFVPHAFVRTPDGAITTFDIPGAVNGTFASGINLLGATTGSYTTEDFVDHGFVRSYNGTITTFEVLSGQPTDPASINLLGQITGSYWQPEDNFFGGNYRGFLRANDGGFTTFDAVPSPSDPCCTWTFPESINLTGEIVGVENDAHSKNHGLLRDRKGEITILDAPGALHTYAFGINQLGVVAGYYYDANRVSHGFLWIRH